MDDEIPDWFVENMAVSMAHEQDNVTIRDETPGRRVAEVFGENGEWDEGLGEPDFSSDSATHQPAIGLEEHYDIATSDGLVEIPFYYEGEYTIDFEDDEDGWPEPVVKTCIVSGKVCLSYNGGDIRAWAELDVEEKT